VRGIATGVLAALVAGPGFTTGWLAQRTGFTRKQTAQACALLLRRGYIASRVDGKFWPTDAGRELVEEGRKIVSGRQAGTQGRRLVRQSLREKVWRAMVMLRKATIPELVSYVSVGGERDAENNILKYLRALEKAGYVVRDARRVPGTSPTSPGFVRWVLIEKTGPVAPAYSESKKHLYDPNTNKEIPL
jgi:hypothetical protein